MPKHKAIKAFLLFDPARSGFGSTTKCFSTLLLPHPDRLLTEKQAHARAHGTPYQVMHVRDAVALGGCFLSVPPNFELPDRK